MAQCGGSPRLARIGRVGSPHIKRLSQFMWSTDVTKATSVTLHTLLLYITVRKTLSPMTEVQKKLAMLNVEHMAACITHPAPLR